MTIVAPHSIRVQLDDVVDSLLRPEAGTGTGGFKLSQVVEVNMVVVKMYLNM